VREAGVSDRIASLLWMSSRLVAQQHLLDPCLVHVLADACRPEWSPQAAAYGGDEQIDIRGAVDVGRSSAMA
jgi:hypothetical protein